MPTNIFVFGASITYGAWDTEKGGWVQRLRSFLESNQGKEFLVYNLGISGDDTNLLLKRFESELKDRIEKDEENIIIISIGINDSANLIKEKRIMTSREDYEKNICKLFDIAKKYSQKIVFIGLSKVDEPRVTPISWNKNISYSNENIIEYNKIVQKVCQENKVLSIDLFNKIDKNLLEDGLHPNSKGHQKMFEIIKDALIKNKII